jgi:hypothetical protein
MLRDDMENSEQIEHAALEARSLPERVDESIAGERQRLL